MMQISILGYGESCRGMAALCAESLVRLGHPASKVSVWTDRGNWFREKGYQVRELSASRINEWKGPYDFALRLKILMMREILTASSGDLQIFSDADIYWRKLPDASVLEDGKTCLMHALEPYFDEAMLVRYGSAVGDIRPVASLKMYNSGVLGFPEGFPVAEFDTILEICDHICDLLPRNLGLAEQVAYTAAFQSNYRIETVDERAYHYWMFNDEFARLMRGKSLDQWAELTFADVEKLNAEAEALYYTPLYRWQNRFRKLKRSWKKSKNARIARARRSQ